MGKIKIEVEAFQCNKCQHVWQSGKKEEGWHPVVCPGCGSPYWDRPSKALVEKKEGGA